MRGFIELSAVSAYRFPNSKYVESNTAREGMFIREECENFPLLFFGRCCSFFVLAQVDRRD